jgi:hypothetical protein
MKLLPQDEEMRRQLVQEARYLAVASPVLDPMLEKRKEVAFRRLLSQHRGGGPIDPNIIAELSVIDSLQNELKSKLEYLALLEEKHGNRK